MRIFNKKCFKGNVVISYSQCGVFQCNAAV